MRTIIRLQKQCNISGKPLQLSHDLCIEKRQKALQAYRLFRKTARKSRSTWLDTLIEQHILNGDTDAATTVRPIKKREDQRAMHRRINSSVKARRSTGVTSTIVPSTGTTGVNNTISKKM